MMLDRLFNRVHDRVEAMRLNSDDNVAELGQRVLCRVLDIVGRCVFALGRFCPVFLEKAFCNPSVARPQKRLGQDSAGTIVRHD